MYRSILVVAASLVFASTLALGQSHWSAEGAGMSVWVGAELSSFNPDYGCASDSPFSCPSSQLLGLSPFVDVNHVLFRKLNVEGQGRILHWRGPGNGINESSYMAGPRVSLFQYRRVQLSGKFLVGGAHFSIASPSVGQGQYFAMAPAFVVDMRLTKRVMARAEYEYQIWPSFIGNSGLSPNGFSLGLAYAIKR